MDSVGASSMHVPKILREPVSETLRLLYSLVQAILDWIFSPRPPPPSARKFRVSDKRIAVIGAGLTGVSSAAHCVGNGFEATIFEGRSKEHGLGGVWSVWTSSRLDSYLTVSLGFSNTQCRECILRPLCRFTVCSTVSIRQCVTTRPIRDNRRSDER